MSCAYSEFSFHFLFCSPTARPLPNFIERRDRVEVVERVGPLSAARICSGANTAGKQDLPSYRTAADQSIACHDRASMCSTAAAARSEPRPNMGTVEHGTKIEKRAI